MTIMEKAYVLNEFLDRILDKGVAVNADIIITVADIPLIGISLSAVVAGIETMLEHGISIDSGIGKRKNPLLR